MRPGDLLLRHKEVWDAATRHPFLAAVRDGTLDADVFATWLVQDYLFVADEFAVQARLLARAPRKVQKLLIGSLQGLESELSWFEFHARTRNLALHTEHYPTTAAYRDFLNSLEQKPYAVALTAIWAVERAYLASWQSALSGHGQYREYIEHWANAEFESFVSELEGAVADALEANDVDSEAESAFLNVAQLEHEFWEMAWKGGRQ
jgi:thiaminase/transcriptional activator TenA